MAGFAAARWRPAENPMNLNQWGLGGRGFGRFISWFLLGGDIYTAYTLIAVPALVYATGAAGSTRCPTRSWRSRSCSSSCRGSGPSPDAHNYVTPADFIRGRYGSRGLGLAVAFTGILATMPYIALQLVGIESVLIVLGVNPSSGNAFIKDLPLIIAFVILAAYTFLAGLRAPAMIAFVKDTLMCVTVIVAILYIPTRIGGWGHIFGACVGPSEDDQPGHRKTTRRPRRATGRRMGLRHPGARLGARPVHVPAHHHRCARHQAARRGQTQPRRAARLHADARSDRAVRLYGAGYAGA